VIICRSESELNRMLAANQLVADVLARLEDVAAEGVSTLDLDTLAERLVREGGAEPAFKGYRGFPATLCTSINDEVVHGIPGPRVLQEGDIVGVDIGVEAHGFYSDAAQTLPVGVPSEEVRRLLRVTREALYEGIAQVRAGNRVGDVSWAVQQRVEKAGYSVVRTLVGHGIGRSMHEDPQVPNFGEPGQGPELRPGMALAIEPMVNTGSPEVEVLPDKWTVVTQDGSLSVHFEHTVAVTEEGPMILTEGAVAE
jgi:methionyl aminopeptidase